MTEEAPPFHHAHPVTATQVAAELAREIGMRRQVYPGRVRDGRMAQADMDREIALAAAWAEDVARIEHGWQDRATRWLAGESIVPPPAAHGFTWADRRRALDRELAFRARLFGRRVAEGAMTRAEADHRAACLAALAARYDDGFHWRASNGESTRFGLVWPVPPEIEQARREWAEHRAAIDAANTPEEQKEMAL